MLIDSDIKWELSLLEIDLEHHVLDILESIDELQQEIAYHNFEKTYRLIKLGYRMIVEGNLKKWDWKYANDNGWLCDMDRIWFKDDLEQAGVI